MAPILDHCDVSIKTSTGNWAIDSRMVCKACHGEVMGISTRRSKLLINLKISALAGVEKIVTLIRSPVIAWICLRYCLRSAKIAAANSASPTAANTQTPIRLRLTASVSLFDGSVDREVWIWAPKRLLLGRKRAIRYSNGIPNHRSRRRNKAFPRSAGICSTLLPPWPAVLTPAILALLRLEAPLYLLRTGSRPVLKQFTIVP